MDKCSKKPAGVKRKLVYCAAGWMSGLILCLNVGIAKAYIVLAALAVACAVFFVLVSRKYLYHAVLVLASFLVGCIGFSHYYSQTYQKIIAHDGSECVIEGAVTDYRYIGGDLMLVDVKGKIDGVKTNVTLLCYDEQFDYYDAVAFKFNAKKIEDTPTFDSEEYYRSKGSFIQGDGVSECIGKGKCTNRLFRAVMRLRDKTKINITRYCGGQSGAFLRAVLCSDTAKLSAQYKTAVYRIGIGHLFAVSGTHIVIIVSFFNALFKRFNRTRLYGIGVMLVIWGFALFSGLSPSVVRSCVMMSMSLIADIIFRRSDSATSMGLAAILLSAANPFVITSASFILSFAAAFAVCEISPRLCAGRTEHPTERTVIACLCVNVVCFPICVYFFEEISTISIFSNLILVPMCTAALILGFAFVLTGSWLSVLLKAADFFSWAILEISRLCTLSTITYAATEKHMKFLVYIGLCAVIVLMYYVLFPMRKKRRDLFFCLTFYAAVCIAALVCDMQGADNTAVVIPNGESGCVVLISGRSALVIDLDDCGENAYTAASVIRKYGCTKSAVYLSRRAASSKISYENKLTEKPQYFSSDEIPYTTNTDSLRIVREDTLCYSVYDSDNGDRLVAVISKDNLNLLGENHKLNSFEKVSVYGI